jgi:CubicO group peptidase (beta-lactamase class C family)
MFLSCKTENTKISSSEIIDKYANEFLKDKRTHSVSIVLFNKGKSFTRHFGEQTIGKKNPPNDSTYYELASVTKTFLGTMAAQAVLEGKISLRDTITNYLQEDYPNLFYDGQPISIKHILTHTAGFPNFPPTMENKKKFLEGLKQVKITSEPGKEFHYSNTAPEITAYILEQVYNIPYQKLISKYILEPNGMEQTKFELNEEENKQLIQGYNGNNELQEHFKNNLWGGIGGLHSTTTDLLKYIKYHLNENNTIIKESHQNFFKTSYEFDIGYYWNIVKTKDDICFRHHGGIWGMQNWLMLYPRENIGIAVLSNSSFDGIDDMLETLAINIYNEVK